MLEASQKLKDEVLKRASEIEKDGYHQVILNIMYEEKQSRKDGASYKEILEWYKNEYGELAKFGVLVGKMNQQVTNGGFIQYFRNGYCDGNGVYASEIILHKELVVLFSQSGLNDETSLEVFKILQKFYIEIDEDFGEIVDNENYGEVINTEYLGDLDNAYYERCDEFMVILEQYFKNKIIKIGDLR
ncbi:MAG: hypothetical protein WC667_11730 [Sulfurimonas sp.]|jgi:hypothetical protein